MAYKTEVMKRKGCYGVPRHKVPQNSGRAGGVLLLADAYRGNDSIVNKALQHIHIVYITYGAGLGMSIQYSITCF